MAAQRFFSSAIFRFSIRQLFLGTALVAVGCVALRGASSIWVAALLGLLLLALTAAVPLAIFRQGNQRAWWFGFALFGWLYLLLLAYGWSLDPNTWESNPLQPHSLVTAQLASSAYQRLYAARAIPYPYQPVQTGPVPIAYPVTTVTAQVPTTTFAYSTGTYSIGSPEYVVSERRLKVSHLFSSPLLEDFVNVSHAFWGLLIALCGGWFTCWVYTTRPAAQKGAAETSASDA